SATNFLAISAPIKSPAPITATVWFLAVTSSLLIQRQSLRRATSRVLPRASIQGGRRLSGLHYGARGIPQLVLQDLAGGRCGQRVEQHDLAGTLVRCEMLAGIRHQFLDSDRGTRKQLEIGRAHV